ncbi:MAG: hypothetical protein JWN14_2445 [Chthonomonadales bacterium]|nr:hypothetical protein [Chthonomonadales bacterium]
MTQTQTGPPATYPSAVGAASAAPPMPTAETVRSPVPHWTTYVSVLMSLVTLIGGGLIAYEVHAAHLDDSNAHISETVKDHEARMRTVELLPGRIAVLEKGQQQAAEGQSRIETKVDQILARPSK